MSRFERPQKEHHKQRLVIHAGAHKTATTSLQQWLLQTREKLLAQNIFYIAPSQLNQISLAENFHKASPNSGHRTANKFLRLASEMEVPESANRLMISHESILSYTNMLPRAMQNEGFYGSMESSAACIRALCEELDVRIVFYVRKQDQFIASVYLQYVMRGNLSVDFQTYISRIGGFKSISWLTLLERMQNALPGVDIHVRPFEIIKQGDADFLAEYMNACEIEATEELRHLPLPKSNESISQPALEQILLKGEGMTAPQRRALGLELRKEFPTSQYPKCSLVSDEFSQRVQRFYKSENRELFEKWMPEYIQHCY